jgi:hypothetical protein
MCRTVLYGKFLTVRVMRAGRLDRMLVVAGDHFLYARNREGDLPAARSLTELAARAAAGETWTIPTNTLAPDDLHVLFPAW